MLASDRGGPSSVAKGADTARACLLALRVALPAELGRPAGGAPDQASTMQDPYFAVKEEVEHSVIVVVDLHKRWQELSASAKKSDEWEWTACARARE